MAISINWTTKVISVPKADLTPVTATLYELNIDDFRQALNALQASSAGVWAPVTHNHNTTVTLGGVTFARLVEIINGYTVTFEDGQYAVRVVGGNSNIEDVTNINQVSLRTNNSAGLIVVEASGETLLTEAGIAAAVRNYPNTNPPAGSVGADIKAAKVNAGNAAALAAAG